MTFIGNALLVFAAAAALIGIAAFLLSLLKIMLPVREVFTRLARLATYLTAGFMTIAVGVLLLALLSHDFSLLYVYGTSTRDTSLVYLISALWAGNAGSLLLWGWLTAVIGAILLWRGKLSKDTLVYTLSIVLITELFFLILLFLPNANQNPFNSLSPVPPDGMGMNPLLQNPGMIFHPPALLAGWALILAPFAMAIGTLITRQSDGEWLKSARRWALASWTLLGIGNLLGAWWAYYELGWGGYWAWDPVENAGLMPWLLVTAFLHTTMIWRRRGFNKLWSIVFIIFAFLLTIFGAYLTRSDLLSSVHTFGATPAEPVFIAFMVLMLIGAFAVVIIRRRDLKEEPGDNALVSGETTFFVSSLLLSLATVMVFVGTMFPVFSQLFTGEQIEQGADFFHSTAVPVFLALILLSGLGVLIGFKKPNLAQLGRTLVWPTAVALIVVIVLIVCGIVKWNVLLTSFILAFTLMATITKWWCDVAKHRVGKKEGFCRSFYRLFSTNRARYGGYIVHIAIITIAVGVMGSSVYAFHLDDVILSPGQAVSAQSYTLAYDDLSTASTDTSMTITAIFDLKRGDNLIGTMQPAINYYALSNSFTFEAAVRSTLVDDVYISIYDVDIASHSIGAKIMVNPLVMWIWIGSAILFMGGLWAFSTPAKKATDDKDD